MCFVPSARSTEGAACWRGNLAPSSAHALCTAHTALDFLFATSCGFCVLAMLMVPARDHPSTPWRGTLAAFLLKNEELLATSVTNHIVLLEW